MRQFLLFFSTILIFTACKKSVDESYPRITINFPNQGASYNALDTLFTTAIVEDDLNLEWVRVDLLNEQNVAVVQGKQFTNFDGLVENISATIPLDNIHLESGVHYIRYTAYDGTNEFSVFREIQIIEVPLALDQYFLFKEVGGQVVIDALNTAFEQEASLTVSSDLSHAKVNSWDQQITVLGAVTGGITTLDIETAALLGSIPTENNESVLYYHDLYFDPATRRQYISKRDGGISIIKPGGALVSTFNTQSNFRPYKVLKTSEFVLVEERSFNEQTKVLNAYFPSGGSIAQSASIPCEIKGMFEIEDQVWVIGSAVDGHHVYVYDPNQNTFDEIGSFGTGTETLRDAVALPPQIVGQHFFGAGMDNSMLILAVSVNDVSEFQDWNTGATQLVYNPLNNQILGLGNGQLKFFTIGASGFTGESIDPATTTFDLGFNK